MTDATDTGLPPLPGDQFWRVAPSTAHGSRPFAVELIYGGAFEVQIVEQARPEVRVARPGARWWQGRYDVTPAIEARVVDRAPIEDGHLDPEGIREAAHGLLEAQGVRRARLLEQERERARREALLGDYPPKRLEDRP